MTDTAVKPVRPFTEEELQDRATTIFESCVLCPCGANPREVSAHLDPAWFIDTCIEPDPGALPPYYHVAVVRCPRCW